MRSRGHLDQSLETGGDEFIRGAQARARAHERPGSDDEVMLSARIPRELRVKLKRAAVDSDRPLADCVREAIEQWLGAQTSTRQADAFSDDDSL